MEVNLAFYTDWFEWFKRKALELAKKDPLGLAVFLGEATNVLKQPFHVFEQLGDVLRSGALLTRVRRLSAWAMTNGDPLKGTRDGMRALRLKWDA